MKRARFNRIFGLFMIAVLALTGQSMAAVRAAPDATQQIVICIGAATSVIYTDDEGRPTQAPHICPDCITAFDDINTAPAMLVQQTLVAVPYRHIAADACFSTQAPTAFRPRAPPR